ncbi:antitoxin Xre-like helix-turn-helix domain-containing protein [Pusillimonas sp. ANT_WB101]|uniref:type II RES/Xre toxin-antitoxin system antitoxin n=1 Tax=Pusillimonas sp. ANT_WB101 TaxID=2597356 RepID=UPI0011ED91DD|nr:antitoxin Xre-like helix-turn-helix domain-containing protein [Pusillimonas sp. ANT_WB101]KAA0911353.1 DUF2384 domain-containing protein [Pusillimonas sp. ANT_WB101]
MSTAVFDPVAKSDSPFWQEIGVASRGPRLYAQIEKGLPFKTFKTLSTMTGINQQDLSEIVAIASATLQRRNKAGRFSKDESDRIYRLAHLLDSAIELFEGDRDAAKRWISKPIRGLGGARPVDMIGTYAQSEAVFDLIGRLEHGVFS